MNVMDVTFPPGRTCVCARLALVTHFAYRSGSGAEHRGFLVTRHLVEFQSLNLVRPRVRMASFGVATCFVSKKHMARLNLHAVVKRTYLVFCELHTTDSSDLAIGKAHLQRMVKIQR